MAKEGVLSGIAGWRFGVFPIGAVATGAAVGGLGDAVSGLVQGFIPAVPSWVVKFGMAFMAFQWLPGLVGTQAAQMGGLFLTYDGVQELFNIRGSVSNIVGGITGKVVKQSPPTFQGASDPYHSLLDRKG